MSDDDDYDDEEGSEEDEEGSDEEGSDEEEEEEDEDEGENEEALKAAKEGKVMKDIDLLFDLALYVDRVSKRMKRRLVRDYEDRLEEEEATDRMRGGGARRRGGDDDLDGEGGEFDPPVWQNYEQMDEADRASLLERAIMVLGEDRSEGGPRMPHQAPDLGGLAGGLGGGSVRASRARVSGRKVW